MARDCVALMTRLGHERFAVVGHDRGGYVATRLALDHPERVTHLAALDVVPIGSALAGLGTDRAHDDADRAAGRRVKCPVLVLWAAGDNLPELYGDVLAVWREWADDVRGRGLDCGHHLAEEAPEELVRELRAFTT